MPDSERASKSGTKGTASTSLKLSKLIEGYLLDLRAEGRSPNTIAWYTSQVGKFSSWAGEGAGLAVLSPAKVRAFLIWLQEEYVFENTLTKCSKRIGSRGLQAHAQALRAFASWLHREGYADSHVLASLRLPRAQSKEIATFSNDQIKALLKAINTRSATGARDCAFILLLLDTGLRVSEACSLTLDHLNLDEATAKVMGKGGNERTVPLGVTTRKALWKWVNQHRPRTESHFVFVTSGGDEMARQVAGRIVKRRGDAVGLTGVRCSPHTFRHTFAISYLRNGGDVFTLQHILGHTTMDMVRRYVNVASTDVQAAHRKFSPVDNLALPASKSK